MYLGNQERAIDTGRKTVFFIANALGAV